MPSRILTILAVLVGGIIAAIVFVLVGCIGSNPPLVAYCGHEPFGPAILVAFAAWLVLGTIAVGVNAFRKNE